MYLLYMIIIFRSLNPLTCRNKRGFKPIHFLSAAGGAPVATSTTLPTGCLHERAAAQHRLSHHFSLQREGQLCASGRQEGCTNQVLSEPWFGVLQIYTSPRLPLWVEMSENKQPAELN